MPNLFRRYQPTGQTWLISMHCSDKTIHFLSVSDGPTSILLDIVITLRKSHEIIFVTYFRKTKNTCERCFWDVSETSQKRHLFGDVAERSLRYLSQWRSGWDLSETANAGWVSTQWMRSSPSTKWRRGVSPRFRFIVLCLMWVKRIRRQGEFRILFCNSNNGNLEFAAKIPEQLADCQSQVFSHTYPVDGFSF